VAGINNARNFLAAAAFEMATMEIQEIKTWQWVLAGLVIGALFSCIYTWNGPAFDTQARDTIEQGEFENSTLALTKFARPIPSQSRLIELHHKGLPLLRDVTVHPPIASDPRHYWVTGRAYFIGLKPGDPANPKSPEKVFEEWRLFKYPASIPYAPGYTLREEKKLDKNAASRRNIELTDLKKALGGQTEYPTVSGFLKAVAALPNSEFKYQYAWWELPKAVWTLPPLAGLLIFGIAFPLTLSVMYRLGLGHKPVPVQAKPKPAPVKKPTRPVPGVLANTAPQAPAPVAPPTAADTRKYGGEFYPVVKTGKD
jgi:hypothetical protein